MRGASLRFQRHLTMAMIVATSASLMLAATFVASPSDVDPGIPSIAHPMHSHNDYYQAEPLIGALRAGARSIEVDVFPGAEHLMVAHDRHEIRPERTFAQMYGVPLAQRLSQFGAVYEAQPDDQPVILLVDFKGDPDDSLDLLIEHTRPLERYLVRSDGHKSLRGKLLVVVSGNTPRERISSLQTRDIFVDGRLPDLNKSGLDATVAPLVSSNWSSTFRWTGHGAFPEDERARLEALVRRAHDRGQAIRFWATPDHAGAWSVLHEVGVDLINTDRPDDLAVFLTEGGVKGERP